MSGKPVDRTGQRVGRLTLIEYAGKKRWKCLCDCGNEVIVETHSLTRGRTKSCGCLYRDTRAMNLKDRTGMRFGRLVVTEYAGNAFWKCKCDCGNEIVVKGAQLDNGHTKSCGCYHRDQVSKAATTHGASKDRLYTVWQGMKGRCYDSSRANYKNYGGRGITICDEWLHDFAAFRDWAMANGYDPDAPHGKCTIDRIDVDGNYEPSNCRWVDMKVQSNNKHPRKIVAARMGAA